MDLMLWIIIFIVGIIVLIKAADYFTDHAEKLGRMFGMSDFVIGVLIVAFGTSLPEFATSIMAKFGGESAIVTSNVFGSTVVNILVGFGFAFFFIKKIKVEKDVYYGDLPIFVASMILIIFTSWDGMISWAEAILYIVAFVVYLFYLGRTHEMEKDFDLVKPKLHWKNPVIIVVSLVAIFVASKYIVEAIIHIGEGFNISSALIAASALALGTSLPEIAIAVNLAKKGKFNMLIGNLLGSNIFNVLFIVGVTGVFGGLIVSTETIYVTIPFLVATTFLFWVICHDRKITRTEGFIMLVIYVLFIAKLFNLF